MSEAKSGLRAKLEAEIAAAGGDEDRLAEVQADFQKQEREMEHSIDHTVHTFTAAYDLVRPRPRHRPTPLPMLTAAGLRGSRTTSSRRKARAARARVRVCVSDVA